MPIMYGAVGAPSTTSAADGQNLPVLQGKQGEFIETQLHGTYYANAYRSNMFYGAAPVLTVPVTVGSLVSVFSLYNPAGNAVNLEVVRIDLGVILATTVVDTLAVYFQTGIGSSTTIPSGMTVGTATGAKLGTGTPQGKFLTAATHVGAVTLHSLVTTFGAVTTTSDGPLFREYNGSLILPPASIISLAMTTASGTASGLAAGISWVEVPI